MKFRTQGFTLIELLVSIAVIGILMSYVVANFRTNQKSGQIDGAIRQLISNVSMTQTWATAGKLTNGTYPVNGYAVVFDAANKKYTINRVEADKTLTVVETVSLPPGITMSLCHSSIVNVTTVFPCASSKWTAVNSITAIFASDAGLTVDPDKNFIGGILQQTATGRKAYFYISKNSGLVTGDTL